MPSLPNPATRPRYRRPVAYVTPDGRWRVEVCGTGDTSCFELRQAGVLRMVARTPEALNLWLRVMAGVGLADLRER